MKFLLAVALLCAVYNGVQGRITNLAQLKAIEAMSMSPYPWGEWVKFRAAMSGVDLSPQPAMENDDAPTASADEDDDDDLDLDDEQDPEVIEFLKRSAAAFGGEEGGALGGKKSKKTKAKKAPKLKPWEAAIAAKKVASTTTTPATTTDFSISYSELVKAILAAHDEETGKAPARPTTTTELPFDPENINYDELANAILGVEKQRQEAAATPAQ